MLKIKKTETEIAVYSDYNAEWKGRAKAMGGKWNKEAWVFEIEKEQAVMNAVKAIYGYAENGEIIEVRIDFNKIHAEKQVFGSLKIGSLICASRHKRDWAVQLKNGAWVEKGTFDRSGGSANYPAVTWREDMTIRVKIPRELYDSLTNYDGIEVIEK
jgi:hypothetical protein